MQLIHRDLPEIITDFSTPFGVEEAKKARAFHRAIEGYAPTPLCHLSALAGELGVADIFVKDESYRFSLNAFKVLGGSYCIGQYMQNCKDRAHGEVPTFVTATDGNHGRGIAFAASRLGCRSVVYMPRGSAPERLANIRALGSDACVTNLSYDEAVAYAASQAEKNGWLLVQDTSFDGYTEIPTRIMQGYTTLALEITEQLRSIAQPVRTKQVTSASKSASASVETAPHMQLVPTHIFLQAGVGSFAAAMAGFFADYYKEQLPVITVVEPDCADCLFRTAKAGDGKLHAVTEEMNTIMAGLACGVPSSIAVDTLNRFASNYISMPDSVAATGMRILANPIGDDTRVISGESGAAGFGAAVEILRNESLASIRETLALDKDSRILCISTEGATDRENYRRIVWDGTYSD